MDCKVDVDRYCNEVESEFRCWIDFELTLAAEFVLVNFHNGLEGVVLKIPDIPTISKLPCLICKGPAARAKPLDSPHPRRGSRARVECLTVLCRI